MSMILKTGFTTRLHKVGNKQDGVVLISCIIFLILILLMLRITLSSAKVTEQKSGIDQDIALAKESAQLALRAAEEQVTSVISKENLSDCKSRSDSSKKCMEQFRSALVDAWTDAWPPTNTQRPTYKASDIPAVVTAVEKIRTHSGFYSKSTEASCTPKKPSVETPSAETSSAETSSAKPSLWECINWNTSGENYYHSSMTGTFGSPIKVNSITELNGSKVDVAPRYIIERFLPEELSFPSDANLIFRITAVGFGQSGGSNENVTNIVFQANYAL